MNDNMIHELNNLRLRVNAQRDEINRLQNQVKELKADRAMWKGMALNLRREKAKEDNNE